MSAPVPKQSFSLVELLFVVMILSLLAAVAIPRFADSTEEAKLTALQRDLALIREAIQRYAVEHKGRTPERNGSGANSASMQVRLSSKTDPDGRPSPNGSCGPYLKKWPANPFNNLETVRVNGPAGGAGTHGWHYDSAAGIFAADDSTEHAEL